MTIITFYGIILSIIVDKALSLIYNYKKYFIGEVIIMPEKCPMYITE